VATALSEIVVGIIAALFGLSHQIVDQAQYCALVAAVTSSAVVPTLIAKAYFLPHHLQLQAEIERGRWVHLLGRL